jgi:hypothetical protein
LGESELRRAKNETMFREVNERIVDVQDGNELEVLCECGDPECIESLRVTLAEYEAIRADPTAFVVVPGHENLDVDHIQREQPAFLIVTKQGVSGRVRPRTRSARLKLVASYEAVMLAEGRRRYRA